MIIIHNESRHVYNSFPTCFKFLELKEIKIRIKTIIKIKIKIKCSFISEREMQIVFILFLKCHIITNFIIIHFLLIFILAL